ncbi:MAG: cytochrome c oxidase subunit 3 [Fuerstiella sp.]|nr:cytochrome c oxidase subunit 3 [Fuerstiella sp.]
MSSRWAEKQSLIARRFILATTTQAAICIGIAWTLAALIDIPEPSDRIRLPKAFQFGTFCLLIGSWFLHVSHNHVQGERQMQFRRSLLLALLFAVLFTGVQSYGLWAFMRSTTDYQDPQLNTHGFVFMFAALHAMHFLVAQSVLLWVTLSAFLDRYDHEYYWGVTFATWFWHALGIAWIAILCVFSIAS